MQDISFSPANKKLQASVLRPVFPQPVSASLHSGIKFLPVSLLAVSFLPRFFESVLFRPAESLRHFPSIRHQGTIPDTRHVPSLHWSVPDKFRLPVLQMHSPELHILPHILPLFRQAGIIKFLLMQNGHRSPSGFQKENIPQNLFLPVLHQVLYHRLQVPIKLRRSFFGLPQSLTLNLSIPHQSHLSLRYNSGSVFVSLWDRTDNLPYAPTFLLHHLYRNVQYLSMYHPHKRLRTVLPHTPLIRVCMWS